MKKIIIFSTVMVLTMLTFLSAEQRNDGAGVKKVINDYDNSLYCFVTANNINCFFYIDDTNGNSKIFQAQLAMALNGTINITQVIYESGDYRTLDGVNWYKVKRLYVEPK